MATYDTIEFSLSQLTQVVGTVVSNWKQVFISVIDSMYDSI